MAALIPKLSKVLQKKPSSVPLLEGALRQLISTRFKDYKYFVYLKEPIYTEKSQADEMRGILLKIHQLLPNKSIAIHYYSNFASPDELNEYCGSVLCRTRKKLKGCSPVVGYLWERADVKKRSLFLEIEEFPNKIIRRAVINNGELTMYVFNANTYEDICWMICSKDGLMDVASIADQTEPLIINSLSVEDKNSN